MKSVLRRKITAQVLIVVVVAFAANLGIALYLVRDALSSARIDQIRETADTLGTQIDSHLSFTAESLELWRGFDFVTRVLDDPEDRTAVIRASQSLRDIVAVGDRYASAHIIDVGGNLIASSRPTLVGELKLADHPFVAPALAGRAVISSPMESPFAEKVVFAQAVPILDPRLGRPRGAFLVTTELEYLAEEYVLPVTIGETGYAYVVDGDGTVLIHPELAEGSDPATTVSVPPRLLEGDSGLVVYGDRGSERLAAFRRNEESGWRVVAGIEESEINQTLVTVTRFTVLASTVSLLLLLFLISFVVGRLVRPVQAVSRRIGEAAEGGGDLTAQLDTQGEGEVKKLVADFNQFVSSLRQIVGQVKESIAATDGTRQEVEAHTEATLSAATQISGSTAALREKAETVNERLGASRAEGSAISQSLGQLTEKVDEQSAATEESTASIEETLASLRSIATVVDERTSLVEQLHANAGEGKERADANRQEIRSVAALTDRIGEIAAVVGQITARTNLLSMNAAIEAAHAGSAGRGFAVVAEEVRALAEESSVHQKDITKLVKEINGQIAIADRSSEQNAHSFGGIYEEVDAVRDAFREIGAAVNEISTGSDQVLRAMHTLRENALGVSDLQSKIRGSVRNMVETVDSTATFSEEIGEGMREIDRGTEGIREALERIRDLVGELSEKGSLLDESVRRFKT